MESPKNAREARRIEIVERLGRGERGSDIARAVGVSRQYVFIIAKKIRTEGEERVRAPGRRGRKKDQPITPEQAEALQARIEAGVPGKTGLEARWTLAAIGDWFRRTFQQQITVYQLRRFAQDRGLRMLCAADLARDMYRAGAEAPANGAEGRRGWVEPEVASRDYIESLARANAQAAQRMREIQQEQAAAPDPAPVLPVRRIGPKLGRNDPCPLDPTKKFKRCCGATGASWCVKLAGSPGQAAAPAAGPSA